MANYATLKSAIQNVVKTNGNNEITGALLQQSLLAMIDSLGAGYQFAGVAIPSTNPGTPDQNVFYMAGSGTFPNFNNTIVPDGQLAVFKYNGSWTTDLIPVGKNYDAEILYKSSRVPGLIFMNIFNALDKENQSGYYVSSVTGSLTRNANYIASHYIPVFGGRSYYISYKNQIAWYDSDKNFISGSAASETSRIQIAPQNAAFLRCSISLSAFDTFMVAESTTEQTYVKYGIIRNDVLEQEIQDLIINALIIKPGKNKFDVSAATNGRLREDGTTVGASLYKVSGFIPVSPNVTYCISDEQNIFQSGQLICFYDNERNFLSYQSVTSGKKQVITTPNNCYYFRFVLLIANIVRPQVEIGTERTNYVPYSEIGGYIPEIKENTVYNQSIVDNAITTEKVLDGSISAQKTDFIISKNLLNKNDSDVAIGKYIISTTGNLSANAGYNTSGFIKVFPGATYYFGSIENQVAARFYAFFDENKTYVSGGSDISSIVVPENVVFIRFSFSTSIWNGNGAQLSKDAIIPYTEYQLEFSNGIGLGSSIKAPISSLGNAASITNSQTLASGETLTFDVFPRYQLRGLVMSFACKILIFSELIIGKGYQQRLGKYIRITSTNVELISCDLSGNETVKDVAAHGLSINTFLRVSLQYVNGGQLRYIISSIGGYFTKTVNWGYIGEYQPFVMSVGTSATELTLAIGSLDLKKSVWAFGDSYMSISPERWPGVLQSVGVESFMINALSGINSVNMLTDAIKAFKNYSPKFAIWGLGMNDSSDTDNSTPAPNWLSAINSFLVLCSENGTIPILATIPCVPSKNHAAKNSWVRSSGYRYIDFADAVGANVYTSGVNNWYENMLSSDEIHPTALGAQALASRVLADFPEILQYND